MQIKKTTFKIPRWSKSYDKKVERNRENKKKLWYIQLKKYSILKSSYFLCLKIRVCENGSPDCCEILTILQENECTQKDLKFLSVRQYLKNQFQKCSNF